MELHACVCVYFVVAVAFVCGPVYISVFLLFFQLNFHQITNSNELPLAIIAHFAADPTRWEGQSVQHCVFVRAKTGRGDYQNVEKQIQDAHCGLGEPLCAQIYSCLLQ